MCLPTPGEKAVEFQPLPIGFSNGVHKTCGVGIIETRMNFKYVKRVK